MMKRKMMAAAAMCTVMVFTSGCGEKKQETKAPVQTQAAVEETTLAESTEAETKSETKAESEKQMTAVIEENKGFMITVISEEDKEAYVFPVDDQAAVKDLKAGDKVVVTYEGDPGPASDYVKLISVKKA